MTVLEWRVALLATAMLPVTIWLACVPTSTAPLGGRETTAKMVGPHCVHHNVSVYYSDVIMVPIASQITSLTIVDLTVYSDADQRKHQSSASRKRREWPLLLAKPSSAHGWTGRKLRPGNCHGLPWWLWNLSPCPSFFTPPTTSFPPLLTTSSGASQEMTPVRCASLQEGPCGMFFHPVGVHSRCTYGAITECSPYWLT